MLEAKLVRSRIRKKRLVVYETKPKTHLARQIGKIMPVWIIKI